MLSTPGSWPGLITYIQNGNRRDLAFRDLGIALTASASGNSPGLEEGLWVVEGGNVGIKTWAPGNYPLKVNEKTEYGLAINHASSGQFWEIFSASAGQLSLFHGLNFRGSFDGTSGVYSPISDRRLKTDIQLLPDQLPSLMQLKPSAYAMKDDPNKKRELGLIAQEVQAVFPELVIENLISKTGETILTLNYTGLIPVAIKAIQEQQAVIEQQAQQIKTLEQKLEEMDQRLKALER